MGILILLLIGNELFAQVHAAPGFRIVPGSTNLVLNDSIKANLKNGLQQYLLSNKIFTQAPLNIPDSIPNAISQKLSMPVYKGNNGKGFDVYESTVDNMPLLVPDKKNEIENAMPGSASNQLDTWYKALEKPKTPSQYQMKMQPLVRPIPLK